MKKILVIIVNLLLLPFDYQVCKGCEFELSEKHSETCSSCTPTEP